MRDLNARLQKLERAIRPPQQRKVRQFVIEGPKGLQVEAAEAFLRKCGHDLRDEDHNIIRIIIGAENGRPVDLRLKDITARYSR
ncbi:hypothetical protein MKK88_14230 [Methylobacterium sp. E-005]|uniref:hypothetical protein n=1 Tax=Methylobacterium sp. E-005 TaxID=2836549 RepID=UPI001FBB2EF7|nr:hypothetical protein [Methylobacterium sp. E-005]MCJ2087134.1 hypothetical protein [Methylobacterium sp. E-005]